MSKDYLVADDDPAPIVVTTEDGEIHFPDYLDEAGRPRSPSLYDVLERLEVIEEKLDALAARELVVVPPE